MDSTIKIHILDSKCQMPRSKKNVLDSKFSKKDLVLEHCFTN